MLTLSHMKNRPDEPTSKTAKKNDNICMCEWNVLVEDAWLNHVRKNRFHRSFAGSDENVQVTSIVVILDT